jgi:short-subunit dehydrogenase
VLINNAGVSHNRAFLNLSPEQIERTIKINCLAHLWTTKEFLPKMLEKNHGHIVATCSMGGIMAVRGNTPYYSSKFAVRAAMIALKDEVVQLYPDKTGINFTIVYPWFVKTPLIDNLDVQFR